MNFVLNKERALRLPGFFLAALMALVLSVPAFAQGYSGSEVGGESVCMRSIGNGRWVDHTTWEIYRSGMWVRAANGAGAIPDAGRNVFIETNHTIIATRAQVNGSGASRDYNGNQSYAFVEVNDLHLNTAASVTTTWGVYPGRISGGLVNGAGVAQYTPASVIWANNSQETATPLGLFGGNATAPTMFSGMVSPTTVGPGTAYPYPVLDRYNGDRFGGHVRWETLESYNSAATGGLTAQRPDPDFASWELDYSAAAPAQVLNIAGCPSCPIGYDVDGSALPRPRNNELRVYGKLRYYVGAASGFTDRAANIQVTAATIGTGSTIVFRGGTRWITQPNEWSTTLATTTGRFDNSVFSQTGSANADANNSFRGLMGRNSFWTAIFDLGRLRDRMTTLRLNPGTNLQPGTPNMLDGSKADLFGGMNDYPDHAIGMIGGNFTAGIIQVRRGVVEVRGQAFLANEGGASTGSIQVMNNAVLRVKNENTQIGRTAVSSRQFANGMTDAAVNGLVVSPHVDWSSGTAGGAYYTAKTPDGPYYVTSRMRYFVVEEGGALDFNSSVGADRDDNGTLFINAAGQGGPVIPLRADGAVDPDRGIRLGATLSACDVRFNGTVMYSKTGNQTLVQDSPFLSFNPGGAPAGAAGSPVNNGENGVWDPYNNLRDPYNINNPGVTTGFTYSVGAAAVFAPATTAAYSHLTLRGTGNKFLIATTVVISRTLLMQGTARLKLAPQNTAGQELSAGFAPQHMLQPNMYGTADAAAAAGSSLVTTDAAAAVGVPLSGKYPPLVFLRSTGLWGFREENNIGTHFRYDLYADPTGKGLAYGSDQIPVMAMWSAYGGNTDPVAFVGFTTASTSIVPMYGSTMSFPVGMVLSGSTNREQMDMTPWNKPAVIHGLPCEPSYPALPAAGALPSSNTHGWSARAVQYPNMDLSSTRWGQVIRQSVDRVNGAFTSGIMHQPSVTATPGAEQENFVCFRHEASVISNNATRQGTLYSTWTPTSIRAGNFPVITNSLYDFNINTTATTTLEYDSEAGNVMSQAEFPNGTVGPHNLVMNMLNGDVNTLPVRTDNLYPYDGQTDIDVVNRQLTSPALPLPVSFSPRGRAIWGVTGGTIVIGPEYTNSANGHLPRQAFNPTWGNKNAAMYQAGAFYDREDGASPNSLTAPTAGSLASAYVDTRPDVGDYRYKVGYLTQYGNQAVYSYAYGLRPGTELTGTMDGRVRVGFPRTFMNAPQIYTYVGNLSYTIPTYNSGAGGNTISFRTPDNIGSIVPTNDVSDFGRRGDFNNFGVVELRRGTLVIPQGTEGTNGIEARAFPFGAFPGMRDARLQPYTFTLVTVAILSSDQSKVTYQGKPVGSATDYKVCMSEDPDGGGGTLSGALVGVSGGPNPIGVRAPGVRGTLVVRGASGPLNLSGTMHGGNFANILFTGGTGGTIDNTAIRNAIGYPGFGAATPAVGAGTALTVNSPYYGPFYGATAPQNGWNNGLTELTPATGVLGAVARQPSGGFVSYKDPTIPVSQVGGGGPGYPAGVYNPGPEMTTDYDATNIAVVYNVAVHGGGAGNAAYSSVQAAAQVDYNTGASTAHSGNNQPGYGLTNAQVERANNSYNIDLPYIRAGVNHFTFMRATTNVCTLLGNRTTDVEFPTADNIDGNLAGISTWKPEQSGLIVNGTIATARGDIDLNGRNIELQGNNSYLHEAFFKAQFVDSAGGRPLWAYPSQQYYPRNFSGGTYTAATPIVAFPTAPSSVRNANRSVRAYIGTTSPRNVNNDNSGGGPSESFDEIAGLGAKIYVSGNPMQVRVRRWQTRGNDIANGNITTRPNIPGADRYWQIETTGNQMLTAQSSKLRLQYIDTDLFNENGTTTGLAPSSINIFRTVGKEIVPENTIGATPSEGRTAVPFQALFAQERVGLDSYNYVKQLTLMHPTQVVNGKEVLNTANFSVMDKTNHNLVGTDQTNPDNPKSGFQTWAIGVPSPTCITIRGQRFGGVYGDPIGVQGDGRVPIPTGGVAGMNMLGNTGSMPVNGAGYTQLPTWGAAPTSYSPENSGVLQANGGPSYGGIAAANGSLYGPTIGPFKAGIPTVATILADLLDEFGNVVTTDSKSVAALTLNNPNDGYAARYIASAQSSWQATASNALGTFGGHFEFPNVQINGVHSTQLTLTVTRISGVSATDTQAIGYCESNLTPGLRISLQGGLPYSVTFATVAGFESQRPSKYMGVGKVISKNPPDGVVSIGAVGHAKNIVVGKTVDLGNTLPAPNYNAITVIVRDRFGNIATVPTRATISLGGGDPPINPIYTFPVNNVVYYSNLAWGLGQDGLETPSTPKIAAAPPIARQYGDVGAIRGSNIPNYPTPQMDPASASFSPYLHRAYYSWNPGINHPQAWYHYAVFNGFQVWGTTSNNVSLIVQIQSDIMGTSPSVGTLAGATTSVVNIVNNQALSIAFQPTQPSILMRDPVNPTNWVRVPSQMFVGRVSPSFRVAAVDMFGNIASGDPDVDRSAWTQVGSSIEEYPWISAAAGGSGTATISFPAPGTTKVNLSGGVCAASTSTDPTTAGVRTTNLPSSATDATNPPVLAPSQQYNATEGVTARAGVMSDGSKGISGIYVFDKFKPAGPASPTGKLLDVLMCFSDPGLPGSNSSPTPGVVPPTSIPSGQVYPYPSTVSSYPYWGVFPSVTTANTTWLDVPVVSISSAVSSSNEGGGANTDSADPNVSSLNLLERKVTFGGIIGEIQQKSNAGNIIISRPAGTATYPATIGYTLGYADKDGGALPNDNNDQTITNSKYPATQMTLPAPLPAPLVASVSYTTLTPAPAPVWINTFEGDLKPRTTPAGGGAEQPVTLQSASKVGSISLPAGGLSQAMSFTARYSDQVYPKNPGLQGQRKATISLLEDDGKSVTSGPYTLGTKKVGVVTLNDPKNLAPVILNAIQDKNFTRTQNDVIELESQGARADGLPNTVFYDDNYNPLTYTVESTDQTVIKAEVNNADASFSGRPSLTIRTQTGAAIGSKATVKITANDNLGGTNTDEFVVTIVSSVTASTPVDPSAVGLAVSPNPTTDRVTVQAQAKKTGTVRIKLIDLLGAEVNGVELNVAAGDVYRHVFNLTNLSAGSYKVVINDGEIITSQNLQVTK